MTRREMCTFNEIFCDIDGVMSEEELTEKYAGMSLGSAVIERMDKIKAPYVGMAFDMLMKGGDEDRAIVHNALESVYPRHKREAVHALGGDSKDGADVK